eukprot:scaffold81493_cov15-Tisochrysis_lutea.AAC.1
MGGSHFADACFPCTRHMQPPEVTTTSSEQGVSLSKRLRDAGARMYGAFWCSHCFDQKQEFGKEAMASFPYVECFPNGWRRVSVLRRSRSVRGPQMK